MWSRSTRFRPVSDVELFKCMPNILQMGRGLCFEDRWILFQTAYGMADFDDKFRFSDFMFKTNGGLVENLKEDS